MDEAIYSIALTRIPRVGAISAKRILDVAGSATFVFQHTDQLIAQESFKPWLINEICHPEAYIKVATELVERTRAMGIEIIPYSNPNYPTRLKECEDAPALLYFRGSKIDLNRKHIISIVGTRHMTAYGKQICELIIKDLEASDPDILILSGLALGVDVCAHRGALNQGLDTVGVLAHGLDRIYPAAHRQTATEMLKHGGLLTEFPIGTEPDRFNFVSRNRIIAGMSDATLVVESASKGGSLITADFANMYNRDCFAVPGSIQALYSAGCNQLIKNNKAQLIESATDILETLGWNIKTKNTPQPKQLSFCAEPIETPLLNSEEQPLYNYLKNKGKTQVNDLLIALNIPINKLQTLLFELEMKGLIKAKAGGVYQIS